VSVRPNATDRDHITLIGGYVAAIMHAALARGVPLDALLRASGLERIPTNDPLLRVPFLAFRRMMDTIVESTHDLQFGLYAANFIHASSLHALGLALLASADLGDFCARLCRYFRFLTGSTRPAFVVDEETARLEFVTVAPPLAPAQDAVSVFLVRTIRELSNQLVHPTRIDLAQPTPADGGARHARTCGCPVHFGVENSIIHFDRRQIDLPFESASRELAEHNERIVVMYLAKLDRGDVESRVRAILMQDLPTGAITKEKVARKLAMSPRTLQIKLANHGTSFQTIVDETRFALACGYMDNGALSITEVAYLLGFSDTSNFSRAFRRWSGHSPSEHRHVARDRIAQVAGNGAR
jgi:AraC-like DNA-binding protein